MNFKIVFGTDTKYRITAVESIKITESVESIISTAEITLPGRPKGDSIKSGDEIRIWLWYDDNKPLLEFEGFIKEFSDNGSKYVLYCENEVYKLRKSRMENAEYKKVKLSDLLQKIASASGLKVESDYEFDYDSFAVQNASAYQVLKQLKTDTPSHVFIKSGVLHVHLPFSLDFGSAIYDTRVNIDKDGYGLTFQTKDQRKVRVVYKGKDKDGNQIQSGVKGSPDEDIITVDFKGVTTEETLNRLAEEHANAKMFDGVEGSFTGWLYPMCHAGFKADMRFSLQPERNGVYYVSAVETSFSSSGAKRKITLSKKLS